ncbi:MAG: ferredoxin [Candidatus Shikimatogenerans bostrichidophilus]|nr:MAG: ferredoxin [Candidatus Shikimatogenerans bostrichidophilus]
MITIVFFRYKCIGCGNCELVCPLFFKITKLDGKSILINSIKKKNNYILKNIDNYFLKLLNKASNICPVKIIKIIKK